MSDAESRARRMGWRPESEWADAPEHKRPYKFIGAEEFLAKVENDLRILQARNRFLDGELAKSEVNRAELDELVTFLHERNVAVTARLKETERSRFAAEVGMDERPAVVLPKANGHLEFYDDLSEEEQADCDRFLRFVPGCSVDDWINIYRQR